MKNLMYICAIFGTIMAIVDLFMKKDILLFIDQMIPIIGILFIIPFCSTKIDYAFGTFYSVWITIYNILYIILASLNQVNLYNVPYRIKLQIGVPFLASIVFRLIRSGKF